MCITSETCRTNSVIKTALNNLHQAGPNKTRLIPNLKVFMIYPDALEFVLSRSVHSA